MHERMEVTDGGCRQAFVPQHQASIARTEVRRCEECAKTAVPLRSELILLGCLPD